MRQGSVGGDWGRVLETPGVPGESGTTVAGVASAPVRPTVDETSRVELDRVSWSPEHFE